MGETNANFTCIIHVYFYEFVCDLIFCYVLISVEEKNYRDSIDLLRRLIQIKPQHIDGLTHLATALMESGEMAEAMQLFLSALEINPSHKIALNNLGRFYDIIIT